VSTFTLTYGEGYEDGLLDGRKEGAVKESNRAFSRFLFVVAFALTLAVFLPFSKLPALFGDLGPTKASSTVYIDIDGHGHGSGVYLGHGLVLTAAHVANADVKKLTVKTNKTGEYEAKLIWSIKSADVALIDIGENADSSIAASPLACRKPVEGELVRSEGNPLGEKWLKTWGRVAGETGPRYDNDALTPLDMTILPGVSGGPVFDKDGYVIGLNDAVMLMPLLGSPFGGAQVTGIGYMVPSYVACRFMGRDV
jgi:S1-C subfamily serine protease